MLQLNSYMYLLRVFEFLILTLVHNVKKIFEPIRSLKLILVKRIGHISNIRIIFEYASERKYF